MVGIFKITLSFVRYCQNRTYTQKPNARVMLDLVEVLKKIDAFPKAFDDFRVKTTAGALGNFVISVV